MRFARDLVGGLGLGVAMLALMPHGFAQDARPAEQQPAAQQEPGLLNEIGKLLKSPTELLPSFTKPDAPVADAPKPEAAPPPAPTGSRAPPPELLRDATKAAPTETTRLLPGMVTGRELCPTGGNGAPDCQTGSDRLCQSKGYKSGKSTNTDTAFSCSARIARASGKACGNEHFVTSAFCN